MNLSQAKDRKYYHTSTWYARLLRTLVSLLFSRIQQILDFTNEAEPEVLKSDSILRVQFSYNNRIRFKKTRSRTAKFLSNRCGEQSPVYPAFFNNSKCFQRKYILHKNGCKSLLWRPLATLLHFNVYFANVVTNCAVQRWLLFCSLSSCQLNNPRDSANWGHLYKPWK